MANIGDGFKDIFLAGIGAAPYTGEKGKEVIDRLVEKGELTAEQGRELNEELQRRGVEAFDSLKGKSVGTFDNLKTKGADALGELRDKGAEAFGSLRETASSTFEGLREGAIEAHLKGMSPEERIAFIAEVTRIAEKQNATADEGDASEADGEQPAHDDAEETDSQA